MKDIPFCVCTCITLAMIIYYAATKPSTPIMVMSYSTGACKYWVDDNGKHSCDKQPTEYYIEWGE